MSAGNRLEKPDLYDKDGRIADPGAARKAADIENPYHERAFLKLFRASKKKIGKGEKLAEQTIEEAHDIDIENLPDIIINEVRRLNLLKKSTSGEEIVIENAFQSVVGEGVSRFRLNGYLVGKKAKNYFVLVGETPALLDDKKTDQGKTFYSKAATKIEMIVDVKNNSIVFSEIKRV